ncbi:hypothetical protein [Swingsia samuiensis]|uniref:Uncharacterized protein n=1 Tax=Swingsia samuiensis TaxID=1293412 RepID=A0A4Y6ULW5_9PROT|nr:hypothetical protein [Swingsia samuiensis]QDH17025.1 hypothetical protein E3D00_05190 [Swingsia samuiensis]
MRDLRQSKGYWGIFIPLFLLALVVRLSFGGLVSPQSVFDDPLQELDQLTVFCDHAVLHGQDIPVPHHTSHDDQKDGLFLLADSLELLSLSVIFVLFFAYVVFELSRKWVFPTIRGPPFRQKSAFCPQGPPV